MQVLRKGCGQVGFSMERLCTGKGFEDGGCGALLLVEEGDIFFTESHARDETTRYESFQCPECGVRTDFEQGEVPDRIRLNLKHFKDWQAGYRGPTSNNVECIPSSPGIEI